MSQNEAVLTSAEIDAILNALSKGATVGDACNVSPEHREGLYALAYDLYTSQNYQDAATVFQALSLYDHRDRRFWMGLAGCRQALGDLKGAVDAYAMAGTVALLRDPEPFFYAARCYVQMGDKENAIGAIKGLLEIGDENDPAHAQCHEKARALLALLENQEAL